ncbi:FG-GAP repeat protein [Marinicella sp. S1101]|uniref:FG-GAP repeat protein n=1 Tax=Marinicella marina TaxID=2996016 RepID=UPI002260B50C|nr:FG-GAP repeat protein [Marinicella marina]MCX7554183.1 FG-GAP repeat protein [Marinicella marina]MDJ1141124.1 FG-GAP repeat protein [Marinicella marina]
MFKHKIQFILFSILLLKTFAVQADMDQQRPDGISDVKWSALKSVVQETKLLPSPADLGGQGSEFGRSVSVDGNRALIGAPVMAGSGAVFVFDYDGLSWSVSGFLTPSDGASNDQFGSAVSLSGNRALIGAQWDDDNGRNSGSAYVYDFNGSSWIETTKLTANDGSSHAYLGISVSLSGDRALVGATREDGQIPGSGSAYVYDFDGVNWNETAKLIANDGASNDQFGTSVSVSGDRVVIGAVRDDDGGTSSGSVYVFNYNGNNWNETNKLVASDAAPGDQFGYAVDQSGDRLIIGAPFDDGQGDQSGSVYIFSYDAGSWDETIKLTADDAVANDFFGLSVSISGNRSLVGAYANDGIYSDSGSAYVFDFDESNWIQTAKLTATDGFVSDFFGYSVSLSGNRALIGAWSDNNEGVDSGSSYVFDFDGINWQETTNLTTVDGGVDNGAAFDSYGASVSLSGNLALVGAPGDDINFNLTGSAYIYEFDGTNWNEIAILTASDGSAGDNFGNSVSLSGNRALIGAFKEDDQSAGSGSAYVFEFDGNNWVETAKLKASDPSFNASFGNAVSLSGDRALIGAFWENSSVGSAYVFDYDGINWTETMKLTAADGVANDHFGSAVSLLDNRALVGAEWDDDLGTNSGSVYIYNYDGISWNETTKLIPGDGASNEQFGKSVSLSNNRALVGSMANSAYVFDFVNNNWIESTKLIASDVENNDNFGNSVSLSGDSALVGALNDNNQGFDSGSAYFFKFDGNNWNEFSKLIPGDTTEGDRFGSAVSFSADRVLIGAFNDDAHGTDSGSAYIFDLNNFTIGGSITGLADGNGVVLQNNLTDDLVINTDSSFTFSMGLDDLSDYSVTVLTQPTTPNQTCTVTGGSNNDGSGTLAGADVTDISVTCVTNQYDVNVEVSNLIGDGVSFSNGVDTLTFNSNGTQTISTLDDGSVFDLEITDQPESLNQTCSFTNFSSGTLAGNDVIVTVDCVTLQYSVAVNVSGLDPGNSVVLQNNGADDLIISSNGSNTFNTAIDDGANYSVAVLTQPTTPNQFCQVSQATGQINGANVDDIEVVCATDVHTVGGTVSGLANGNTLTLSMDDTGENLVVQSNNLFEFIEPLQDGTTYNVTVLNMPTSPNQTCTISNGSGTISGSDVSDVLINCEINQYFIGGYVLDLIPANFMVLQNNLEDNLIITEEGAFVFATPIDDESDFEVSIQYQPDDPIQSCEIINNSGTLNGNDVENVIINCDFGDDLIYRHGFDTLLGISQLYWQGQK